MTDSLDLDAIENALKRGHYYTDAVAEDDLARLVARVRELEAAMRELDRECIVDPPCGDCRNCRARALLGEA